MTSMPWSSRQRVITVFRSELFQGKAGVEPPDEAPPPREEAVPSCIV
jgi:hypothetical protein